MRSAVAQQPSPSSILAALVDITAEPPPTDTDAADVLVMAQEMSAARAPLIEELRQVLSSTGIDADCSPLLDTLRDRDARWMSRLVRAQHELQQRLSRSRRRY